MNGSRKLQRMRKKEKLCDVSQELFVADDNGELNVSITRIEHK